MNPEETGPAESTDPPQWGDGRLVIRRPEVPDSDIAAMSVITNDDQHAALSSAVRDLVARLRQDDT
jgi:hypothetical protein